MDTPAVQRPTASDPPAVSFTATSTYDATAMRPGTSGAVEAPIGAAVRTHRYRPLPTLTAVSPTADTSGWRPPEETDARPHPPSGAPAESDPSAKPPAPAAAPPSSSSAGGVTAVAGGGSASSLRVSSAASDRTAATPAGTVGMRIHECVAAVRHDGAPDRVAGGRLLLAPGGSGRPGPVVEEGAAASVAASPAAAAATPLEEKDGAGGGAPPGEAGGACPRPPPTRGGTGASTGEPLRMKRSPMTAGGRSNAVARSSTVASTATSSVSSRGGARGAACMMCGS